MNQQGSSTLPTADLVDDHAVAPPPLRTRHPVALFFLCGGEFAERCSYYGMRAILFMYLTSVLLYADTAASPIYSWFKQACYFLPLVGGYIADRWLGRYWTIVGFSVPYVAGHFVLGIPNHIAMFIALALLAGGSGVIKPNISTLMGQTYDQQRPGQDQLRVAAFNWFYLAINVGALISMFSLPLVRNHYIMSHLPEDVRQEAQVKSDKGDDISEFVTPLLREQYIINSLPTPERARAEELAKQGQDVFEGLSDQQKEVANAAAQKGQAVAVSILQSAYQVAFAFPAWLMVLALVVFAAGKRTYALEKPERRVLTPEERQLQWQTLGRLFGIFALIVLFWFGYEHNDTLWVAFTRDYVDLRVPFINYTVSPDNLQFLNSLFVIILIPVFNVVFVYLDPETRIFTRMNKILAGFLLTAAAVGIMSLAGFLAQGHTEELKEAGKTIEVATAKVSVLWPAAAYIVLTFGEVLLYGTMLELSYSAAPKSMKGMITACFLVTNTIANFLNVWWTPLYGGSLKDAVAKRGSLMPGQFFGITALVVFAAGIAFIFVGRKFQQSQAEAAAAGVT